MSLPSPDVRIRPVDLADAPAIADLVTRNRDHQRDTEPIRPEHFYSTSGQEEHISHALETAAAGTGAMFVIEADGVLAGRIYLNTIVRGAFQSASVGYSVDHACTGRGVATGAVRRLIDVAFGELELHRLQADVLTANVASQRVLAKCGFQWFGRAPDYLRIAGRWQEHELYQLINADHPSV
jgi:[ribosomal protein S5]-alanine N-acetyltransferase